MTSIGTFVGMMALIIVPITIVVRFVASLFSMVHFVLMTLGAIKIQKRTHQTTA
jgi:hypothetical protein